MGVNASVPAAGATRMSEILPHERPVDICQQPKSDTKSEFDEIQYIVCTNDIVVFSNPACGYCTNAQTMLATAGLPYVSVNASSRQRDRLAALTGSSSVPSIWVKGKFIGGCNDGPHSWMGVSKIISNGMLKDFLSAGQK
jgi:glutaredoxin 3